MARLASAWRRARPDGDAVAAALAALCPHDQIDWPSLWASCCGRIRRWPRPPRWSSADWWEEAHSQGLLAACQALQDFDPTYGVPLRAFAYRKVLTGVWTLHRREWSFSTHHGPESAQSPPDDRTGADRTALEARDALGVALATLSKPHLRLIERLYWDGETEAAVAVAEGISQSAVSKRKSLVLNGLRRSIGDFEG